MTEAEAILAQTFEQLHRMYKVVAVLRDREYPRNPALFALMAEGPLAQIQELWQLADAQAGVDLAKSLAVEIEDESPAVSRDVA